MNIIYKGLKANNTAVWVVTIIASISIITSFCFAYIVSKDSNKTLYAVNEKGAIVPLVLLEQKQDKIKIVAGAIAYFVDTYYTIDQFNYQENIEKVLWLADNTFKKEVIEDKQRKGYYNRFLQNGVIQKAKVDEKSIKISSYDPPYAVQYDVILMAWNGNNQKYYKVTNTATLHEVNLNFPHNPFGILYTKFLETGLTEIEPPKIPDHG